jgi:hypothetical protein
MKTVQIKVIGEHPPPTSNPIDLYVLDACSGTFIEFFCSPKIWLPEGMVLELDCVMDGLYISSHKVTDGQVSLIAHRGAGYTGAKFEGEIVAKARIVESPLAKVRFIQKDTKGRRIITGDARPVENSDTDSDSKPGE